MNKLNLLLKQVKTIIDLYEKHAELSGERFNIFSIMSMESDEVRTHSAILAELLNPKGNHSLGSKPLELFVKQMPFFKEEFIVDFGSALCQKEVYVGVKDDENLEGGRVDLIVSDKTGCRIVIENKIYAPEQQNQLERYYNKYSGAKILYLTLDGSESKQSFKNYERISYEYHILNWIEACAKEAFDKPMVREVLNQYAYLIRKLTNQSISEEMSNEIKQVIKDNYLESLEIYKNLEDVRNNIVEDAFSIIKDRNLFFDINWNIKFDENDLWTPKTSQALLFSHTTNSNVFFYLRYEYTSNTLFLGIKEKFGKKSIQRESIKFDADFVITFLEKGDVLIEGIMLQVTNYIKNNIKKYNSKI